MSDRYLAIKVVMMPRDTNPAGTIFGGVLLSYIDQAAAIGARYAIHQVLGMPPEIIVTVAMNKIDFQKPVLVGDVVSFWTSVKKWGRTSITVHVSVQAERGTQVLGVTEAEVVYVNVRKKPDGTLEPVPIRPES
jgi:acyl-CoA thioesterase YciA